MDLIERAAQRLQDGQGRATAKSQVPAGARHGGASSESDGRAPKPAPANGAAAPASAAPPGGAAKGSASVKIDFDRLHKMGILTPDRKRDQMIEELRHIKRHVLGNLLNEDLDHGNLLMVTSALPGEGKTHLAMNLAMSLALERDWTVLLIDADLIRPEVCPRLGVSASRGFMDLLDDPTLDVGDVILRTNVEKLAIIPAGPNHAKSTELLSSQRMRSLLHEISSRYSDRIVIFDTPPMLATTEPAVLACSVGQILLVVEAEKTRHSAIEAALELLEPRSKVRLVLNKVRPQFGHSVFGPYYTYNKYRA